MVALLTKKEQGIVREFRSRKIFQDISWNMFHDNPAAIVVDCPDCDQMEKTRHHAGQIRQIFGQARIHRIQLNGGALNIAPHSPLNEILPRGLVLLQEINETIELKRITTVALYAHYPCGKARVHEISLVRGVELFVQGKLYVKKNIPPHVKVGCFFYIPTGEDAGRTYFLGRPQWEEWREYFLAMDA